MERCAMECIRAQAVGSRLYPNAVTVLPAMVVVHMLTLHHYGMSVVVHEAI